jgi:S-adenosylmethionine decarboxylase
VSAPGATRGTEGDDDPRTLGFGPHLVFDGYGCPVDRLDNLGRLYTLLDRLPDRIHMTKIMPPYVFRHGLSGGPSEGLSGFVLIAESHISMHTFLSRRFVNVDIFSCENFDVEDALSALRQAFMPQQVEWKLFERGREFPKHLGRSRTIVSRDRKSLARTLGLEATR